MLNCSFVEVIRPTLFYRGIGQTQCSYEHYLVEFIFGEFGHHLFFCDEIWTVGPQPVLCAARCVLWRAIMLEDESDKQPAISLKE